MFKKVLKRKMALLVMATLLVSGVPQTSQTAAAATNDPYQQRFMDMWQDLHDTNNGYFSNKGIPYHCAETMIVEATDYGHVTTSEAFSYYMWLEAMYGKFTGDFSSFKTSWDTTEKYIIPSSQDQPNSSMANYNASKPATYAGEYQDPSGYPSKLDSGAAVGNDPISSELVSAYGTSMIYGMHWLLDVDNWYGFGVREDGVSSPSYINTFQRGCQESTFETIPQPCWDALKFGGKNGFLDLFTGDSSYSAQFKYTDAPDADARAIQATYWANEWAKDYGVDLTTDVKKASKMGDYLRYAMFDKYFRQIGNPSAAGNGYNSCHFLMSWYYAWGGGITANWSWKIGSSHNHFGYQNPMAAWILSKDTAFKPASTNGATDWGKSLDRQLEFYQWLQSSEGAIAGGASNSNNGRYEAWPAGTSTFYGMGYTEHPVYADPGSNEWFGMQAWSMQRVAELYYKTNDARAKALLDKWVGWVKSVVKLNDDGTFAVPSTLTWEGQPDTWTGTYTGNSKLHCTVKSWGTDLGVTGSLCNALLYYAKAANDADAKVLAEQLLDRMWTLYRDDKGVSVTENINVNRIFSQQVYVPTGWTGTMPNGDVIQNGINFIDIRSNYEKDPAYAKALAAFNAGTTCEFNYHRFWAQCDVAIANGLHAVLFPDGTSTTTAPTTTPVVTVKPTTAPTATPVVTVAPTATPVVTVAPTATPVVTVAPTATPVVGVKPVVAVTTTNNGNSIAQSYSITAQGGTIDLSKVKIVFTANGMSTAAQNVFVDNAALQLSVAPWYSSLNGSVSGTISNGALTINIANNTQLAAGTGKLMIDLRFAKADWSTYGTISNPVVSVYYDGVQVQ